MDESESDDRYVPFPLEDNDGIRPAIGEEDLAIRESYPLADEVFGPAGWDAPEMDDYNDYDATRRRTSYDTDTQ